MITSKKDLQMYLQKDMAFYHALTKQEQVMCRITGDPLYYIAKYVRYLRKEEYYFNVGRGKIARALALYYFRKKNLLGNKLGFKIPKNCFGAGLSIYHHGEIIVNENARIGSNARLHGGNCIGNKGVESEAPRIGNNLDLGIGAKIIGGVELKHNVRIGANAVVTKSCDENDIVLVGVPAIKMERDSKCKM